MGPVADVAIITFGAADEPSDIMAVDVVIHKFVTHQNGIVDMTFAISWCANNPCDVALFMSCMISQAFSGLQRIPPPGRVIHPGIGDLRAHLCDWKRGSIGRSDRDGETEWLSGVNMGDMVNDYGL